MSSSAPFPGNRPFDSAYIAPTGPIDPVLLRDYVSNNLLHCADQTCARVLVSDMSAVSSLTGNAIPQYTTGRFSSSEWRPIAVYGPFPISCREVAGTIAPYRIRCAIYAAAATSTCAFAVHAVTGFATGYLAYASSSALVSGSDAVVFAAAASATPAWLTPDPSVGEGVMQIAESSLLDMTWEVVDVPGGSTTPVGLTVPSVVFRVMAKGAGEPRLHGVHIAEVY